MSESANRARNSNRVLPHKHCKICHETISVKSDTRICKKEECINKNQKNEKVQKQMRIWMFIFFGIFSFSFIAPIFLRMM
ncbi:MAG: DUF2116 family Zn-ribbon domain-containing protein [Candidatus Poseidoniaceae archaeon]|nr:DUF2116 family Zn-ribbon domain-containing protein [Candidatus Poseidoniaceae archaeon]